MWAIISAVVFDRNDCYDAERDLLEIAKFLIFVARERKAAGGHMIPPLQHVCNGLARPADESMLVRDNGTDIGTTGSKT